MRRIGDSVLLAPTDLSTFLVCRHKTGLDLAVADGALTRPTVTNPFAAVLRRLGDEHEQRYVASLRAHGLEVVDLRTPREADLASVDTALPPLDRTDDQRDRTLAAMRDGADVIVQARLRDGNLAGYADVLRRVETPSELGAWSYEVHDTKLACETKGGTVLQLCAYSELVSRIQGRLPEHFRVITPDPVQPEQAYRVADYTAYFRMVSTALDAAIDRGHEALRAAHYPEPVEHCAVCAWEPRCTRRRRDDDHLSFIANAGRAQRVELAAQAHPTLASVAAMPVPVTFKPARGARETYDRIGHQARVQHQQRLEGRPVFERIPIVEGEGLCCLPAPSAGDVFLDLEGARFARQGGREYLFGVWHRGDGAEAPSYRAWWAVNDAEERAAFEAVIDLIMAAWSNDRGMHVYHFNHYEPTAFKKLVGRHVTRGEALDRLLRGRRFVDLYPIVRQAVRAGVESYSIKKLEAFSGYRRKVTLAEANQAIVTLELSLEGHADFHATPELRDVVEGYNADDCRSTEVLRNWLEALRGDWTAKGVEVPRPPVEPDEASADVTALQDRVDTLRTRLLAALPLEASDPGHHNHPRWLLAYLIDWHRREVNAEWWDYFRLLDLQEEELLDEKKAIGGLEHVGEIAIVRHRQTGKPTGSVIHRYRYPSQEIDIGRKGGLTLQDGTYFGSIEAHDRVARTIDVKTKAARHPSSVFSKDVIRIDALQESVMRLGERLLAGSVECGLDLLYRRAPRLRSDPFEPRIDEAATDFAVRITGDLDRTTLAIQGPPGAGKTYAGARMICGLVRAGRKVGVTATSHKVIRNLLTEVAAQAARDNERVLLGARVSEAGGTADGIKEYLTNAEALAALAAGDVCVLGGTAWLWAPEDAARTLDVLFVDEAGQMSLANVLAVSQAADSLVLLGDPQQLDQPQKASHPDGVGISALQHVLGGSETMPRDRGIFLPTTHRMSPTLCGFTSELFYEGKLDAKASLAAQELRGTGDFDGSYLWLVPVVHDGNQGAADEEVAAVAALVQTLLAPGALWVDENGAAHALTAGDLRVVAPFNAHVNRLSDRLAVLGVPVGTVDKFQGQTAAVVIYSMATSRPEDAPRGMEFLYSLNRLNVATSRARCAAFIVASPRLFEPDCRTPHQMHLANALCRYRELARVRL